MKIFLDNIIYSKTLNGGVSNYWFELTKFLLQEKTVELNFFEDKKAILNFHRKNLHINNQQVLINKHIPILSRILPINYKSNDNFIYHSSYFRQLSGAKNQVEVTTVYDFIHSFYSPYLNKKIHNNLKFNAIKRAKGIICVSNNTFNDLKKFCPPKKHQKVEVIYNGVSVDYFPIKDFPIENTILKELALEDNYIIFIGGRTNYKNFDFAASAINQEKNLKLVIVGGGRLNNREIKLFSREALDRIIFIPSVSNTDLNILLNNAIALLYPSSYEGFGIPVIEAMRAGCPVIGLNNATINEVASQSALLLEKLNLNEFNGHIKNLKNLEFRSKIIESGLKESQKYSWEKCNQQTLEFYEDLMLRS